MEPRITEQIQSNNQKTNTDTYVIIAVFSIFLSLIIIFSYILVQFSNTKIYSKINVMSVNISGLTKDEAVEKLSTYYSNKENEKLILKVENVQRELHFKDLNVIYYINDAVENAYKLGREGGFVTRLKEIVSINLKGRTVQMPINYNEEKLENIINKLQQDILIEPKDDNYEIVDNKLVFSFGSAGKGLDNNKCIQKVINKLKEGHGDELEFKVTNIEPKIFDVNSIPSEPKDAEYSIIDNKEIKFESEQYGIILNKTEFSTLLNSNRQTKQSFSIPVKVIEPKESLQSLQGKLFRDELGSYTTYYGSSSANRKENVRLASAKIGGLILAPGDEFSYNEVVGPRTPERGFKKAHVYSNGQVVEGYGGGICQPSSTLYNVALKGNFKITERVNHIFTVSYVPVGMDATVSYGSIDFKFKNDKDWPIKIVNETTPTEVIFKILGTKTGNEETVEYRTEIIKTIPYEVEKTFDPTMHVGETKVEQKGHDGYVAKVYRIVKRNGEIISNEFMHKDSYWALKEKIIIGTKPIVMEDELQEEIADDINQDEQINIDQNYSQDPTIPVNIDESQVEIQF